MSRYRGFAGVEYDHVREHVYSPFDWTTFAEPSDRQLPAKPLDRARVALVATAGAHLPEQPPFSRGRGVAPCASTV